MSGATRRTDAEEQQEEPTRCIIVSSEEEDRPRETRGISSDEEDRRDFLRDSSYTSSRVQIVHERNLY